MFPKNRNASKNSHAAHGSQSSARRNENSLLGCDFIRVAFRSAKVATNNATFAEQKATLFSTSAIKSQPIRIESFEERSSLSRCPIFPILCAALLMATFCIAPMKTANGMPFQSNKGGNLPSAGISVLTTPTFSSPGLMITTERGGTAEFRVVLDSQPTAKVTINLTSSNAAEGYTNVPSVVFTPNDWNTPKTVIVTGVGDDLANPANPADGTVDYWIDTAPAISTDTNYNGLNAADVSLSNIDDDSPVTNAIYVRSFGSEIRKKGPSTELRLNINVRHDSDFDGKSEDSDLPIAGVVVVISVYDSNNTIVRNFLLTTNAQGTGTTYWYKLPGAGDYHIEVHDLSLDGFYWDPLNVLESSLGDKDSNGRPDLLLSI